MKNKRGIKVFSKRALIKLISVIVLVSLLLDFAVFFGSADTYYTLRINYVFKDGTPAHDPYVATYQASEDSLHLEVKNPQITGYDPMTATDETGLSAETSTFNLEHIDHNVELTVYYIAGLSTYRVMYYKQNIYDDLYTRDNTISSEYTNRRGKTGTNPTVLEDEELPGYEGFTNLFHEPDSIAADGSTVFRVYYDRNYYHVLFDLGSGGYGVEPVYAKYQSVYHISDPKRPGYSFLGWARTDKDSSQSKDWHYIDSNGSEITEEQALANPISLDGDQTIPAYNTYYKAVWARGTTSFSIVFWLQKPEVTDITPAEITAAGSRTAAQALIGERYNVIASKTVTGITSGTPVNLDTEVQSTNGTTPKVKDFFDFDFRMPENGVTYDFPNMSASMRTELNNNKRYIVFNDYLSDLQFHGEFEEGGGGDTIAIAGDGSTRINVYLKRANFTLKFFYAKTTGGTESTDANGYPTLTGSYTTYLTSGTKNFSGNHNDSKSTDLLTRVKCTGWTRNEVAALPQISEARRSVITPDKVKFLQDGNDRYWYYELPSKYGADLTNTWFNDAFEIMDRKNKTNQYVYFGSWAVEYFSKYRYNDDGTALRGNYTVKGRFEELSGLILYQEKEITSRNLDPTQLAFVASWDNTGGQSWNEGQNKVYNFTYKNYIQLLPCHDYIAEAVGVETLITGGDYPGGIYSKNGLYMPGGYIEAGYYVDIIEMNGTRYGLRADDIIETYDVGDQYESGGKLKTGSDMAKALRENQTAVKITGCTIMSNDAVNYTFDSIHMSDGECVTETITTSLGQTNNPQGIWYDRTDIDDGISHNHHCDVLFFYSRNIYSITYVNITETLPTPSKGRAPFEGPLYMPALQPANDPVYPVAGLEDYYVFEGWYKDPFHIQPVDFEHDVIPAGEVKFYANWVPKTIKVSFYPTYNDYYENANRIGDEITVNYGEYVPHELIPANVEGDDRPRLNPPATGAMFAGWYYLRDNIPVRFEPENLPVTALNRESSGEHATFHLYAEWVTKEVGKYEVKYVEKDHHENEVAEPTTGRAFVWKTRTFNAKGGAQLNAEHAWQEDGRNWWPVVNSHSLVIRANDHTTSDYSPNEYTFEYIQKTGVWYRVQYLDATTHTPLADPVESYTTVASVKADSLFIPGYVAEDMSKTLVLSASEKTGDEAKAEELENNVINFYYNKNDSDYLYEVEYYGQNVDDNNYELMLTENIEVAIADDPDTPAVEPTTVLLSEIYSRQYAQLFDSNGFIRVAGATQQAVTNSDGTSATTALADDGSFTVTSDKKTTIRVYFDRRTYPYTYRYVDYHAERRYLDTDDAERDGMWNGVMETHNSTSNERVEKEVTIPAPTDLTYDSKPYIRISENNVVLTIAPDENNQEVNVINVYYRKFDERELQYKLVCKDFPYNDLDYDNTKNPPQPLYGGLSMTGQTVDAYSEIQSVNFYDFNDALDPTADDSLPETDRYLHNHRYTFLGWFDNPEGTGTPLSSDAVLTPAEMVNYTEELPDYNTTYYAVVEQNMVHANFEIRTIEQALPTGGDSGETEEDRQAAVIVGAAPTDTDGSKTGGTFNFSSPNNYISGNPTPWERTLSYNLRIDPIDNRVYKYEFAEWWEEDLRPESENYHKLIRKKNWNSEGDWGAATVLQNAADLDRRGDKHVIAVFRRRAVTEIPYTINYRFVDRFGETKTFVKTGTLSGEDLNEGSENAKITNDGDFRLTDEFIIANAPYESNYGQTLRWSDQKIEKTSMKGNETEGTVDRIVTNVTAVQTTKTVYAHYRTTPDGAFDKTIATSYGANYQLDKQMLAIQAAESYNGMTFSYWTVRKSASDEAPIVARSYDTLFDLCMMDNYYISPVYESAAQDSEQPSTEPAASEPEVILTHLDYTRNRWTDEEGNISDSGATDLLFTDFEIAFEDNGEQIYGEDSEYRVGVVFERCGSLGANTDFDPARDYGFYSDPTALKTAVLNRASSYTTQNKEGAAATKNRKIQCSEINTVNMTNRNRIEFSQYYKNAYSLTDNGDGTQTKKYTNSNYLLKATAYLIKGSEVTLSNSIYICLKTTASKNLAIGNNYNIWDTTSTTP